MAFSDPTVTIGTTPGAVVLPRTGSGDSKGSFTAADGSVRMDVASSYGKRTRRTIRLTWNALTDNPFVDGSHVQQNMAAYVVVDAPVNGFTATQQKDLVLALCSYLSASSGAATVKLIGGEN